MTEPATAAAVAGTLSARKLAIYAVAGLAATLAAAMVCSLFGQLELGRHVWTRRRRGLAQDAGQGQGQDYTRWVLADPARELPYFMIHTGCLRAGGCRRARLGDAEGPDRDHEETPDDHSPAVDRAWDRGMGV